MRGVRCLCLAVCGAFVVCVLGEPDGDAGVPQGIRVQFTGQVPAVRVDAGRIALLRDDFGKRQRIGSALRPAEAVCTALPLRSGVLDVIEDRKLQVGAGEAFEDGFRLFPGLLLVDSLGVEVDAPIHMVEPGPSHVAFELSVPIDLPGARGTGPGSDDRELDTVLGDFVPANGPIVGGHVDAVSVTGVVDPHERNGDDEHHQRDREELQSALDEGFILFPKLFDPFFKRAAPAPFSG